MSDFFTNIRPDASPPLNRQQRRKRMSFPGIFVLGFPQGETLESANERAARIAEANRRIVAGEPKRRVMVQLGLIRGAPEVADHTQED
jgi:hypothetical protein